MVTWPMMKTTKAHMMRKWSDRPICRLPGSFGYHVNRAVKAGDIEGPVSDRQGGQDEHDPEVRQLLERVVVVEAVRLRRQVEGGVVDEDGPGVGHDLPGGRHQALPLSGAEQQHHEDQAVAHPEQDAEEVPVPGHADGVPVAGQADPGGEVAGVVF